jgi:hypothetical protein
MPGINDYGPGFLQGYDGALVVPSDSTDLAYHAMIWVGGAGAIVIDTSYGTTLTIPAVNSGTLLPWIVRRVRAAGTTATNIFTVK